jgi:MtfA peptidase
MFWAKKWRRRRVSSRRFPAEWLAIIEKNVPYYDALAADDKAELQGHIQIFLAEKRFEGCGGLEITDEIKVTIAAQACILLLHRQTDYYPGLSTILVYPKAYIAHQTEYLESGVIRDRPQVRAGESWQKGAIVLSWDDVLRGAANIHDGQNVVFHEFAHQLDSSGGKGDSSEVLRYRAKFLEWAKVMRQDYEKLRRDVVSNQATLLDAYGATEPAEFFAVATEYFFEKGREVQEQYPELYKQLKEFYHQDPAKFMENKE